MAVPIIPAGCRCPTRPDVVHAVGHGWSGLQAAPAAGVLVADWLLDGAPRVKAPS